MLLITLDGWTPEASGVKVIDASNRAFPRQRPTSEMSETDFLPDPSENTNKRERRKDSLNELFTTH